MNAFLKSFARTLIVAVLIILAVVGIVARSHSVPQWEIDAAAARSHPIADDQSQAVTPLKAGAQQAEFIELIQDMYDVESAQFVRDDYLRVIFSPVADDEEQGTCQAIANIWYNRTWQPSVAVESWHGRTRTAFATVINGRMISPPPPTGRRAKMSTSQRMAARKAAKDHDEMLGKSFAEIEALHGKARAKDATTGWAVWPTFRAHFVAGKAADVVMTP